MFAVSMICVARRTDAIAVSIAVVYPGNGASGWCYEQASLRGQIGASRMTSISTKVEVLSDPPSD